LVGAAGVVLTVLAPAVAQYGAPPTGDVKIETYSGLRRTDTPAPTGGPSPRVTNLATPVPVSVPDAWRYGSTTPPWRGHSMSGGASGSASIVPPPPILRAVASTPPPVVPLAALPVITPRAPDKPPEPLPLAVSLRDPDTLKPLAPKPLDKAVVPASATGTDLTPTAEAKATPLTKAAEGEPSPKTAGPAELSENDLYKLALWQLAGTTSALVIGLFLLTGLALLVARRFGSRTGPLFRVEFAGPAMMPLAYASPAPPLVASPEPEEMTARHFDIGPTYEDELRLRAQAEQQRDEAILQKILEDNMQLRGLLADADGATEFVDAIIAGGDGE
jgi:hypothetical protein